MNLILCFLYLSCLEVVTVKTLETKLRALVETCNSMPVMGDNQLEFTWFFWPTDLSASASFPHKIAFSFEWARRAIFGDIQAREAFNFAIGHELTHKDWIKKVPLRAIGTLYNEIPGVIFNQKSDTNDFSFFSWIVEISCDFGSAKKMFNCDKEAVVNAVDYMVKEKPWNKDSVRYPGWKHREYLLKEGHFDEKLIRDIAAERGCKNEGLIQEVCNYYSDKNIILN